MLSVTHQTKEGPTTYKYSAIGEQCISSYMSQWQQNKRRKDRVSTGKSIYVHAEEVPKQMIDQVVEMRNRGKTWSHIANKLNFTEYLTRNVFIFARNHN